MDDRIIRQAIRWMFEVVFSIVWGSGIVYLCYRIWRGC